MIYETDLVELKAFYERLWGSEPSQGDILMLKKGAVNYSLAQVCQAMEDVRGEQETNRKPTPKLILNKLVQGARRQTRNCSGCNNEGGESHLFFPVAEEDISRLTEKYEVSVQNHRKGIFVKPEIAQQMGIPPREYFFYCAECSAGSPDTRILNRYREYSAGRSTVGLKNALWDHWRDRHTKF